MMEIHEFRLAVIGFILFTVMVLFLSLGGFIYCRAINGDNNKTQRAQVTACATTNDPIGCLNALRAR